MIWNKKNHQPQFGRNQSITHLQVAILLLCCQGRWLIVGAILNWSYFGLSQKQLATHWRTKRMRTVCCRIYVATGHLMCFVQLRSVPTSHASRVYHNLCTITLGRLQPWSLCCLVPIVLSNMPRDEFVVRCVPGFVHVCQKICPVVPPVEDIVPRLAQRSIGFPTECNTVRYGTLIACKSCRWIGWTVPAAQTKQTAELTNWITEGELRLKRGHQTISNGSWCNVFNDAKQRLVGMGSIFLVCYSKPVNPHDATLSRVARATFIFFIGVGVQTSWHLGPAAFTGVASIFRCIILTHFNHRNRILRIECWYPVVSYHRRPSVVSFSVVVCILDL